MNSENPPLDPVVLRAAFNMPPTAAIEFLKSKGYQISWNWHEMRGAMHKRAFTVAKATTQDVLEDIRQALIDAMENGTTYEEFLKNLKPILQNKGWWGKPEVLDGDTGEIKKVQLGSPRRLKKIFEMNTQSALMEGRKQSMIEALDTHPYWSWALGPSVHHRPAHVAMADSTFSADDPYVRNLTLPCGFGCKCRWVAYTEGHVQREGIKVQSTEGRLRTVDAVVGKDGDGNPIKTQRTGFDVMGKDGKKVFFAPDVGFN